MKCPNCNETLLITERHQVEIDYCPSCRGVWLDKGELDKLLSYAADQNSRSEPRYQERKENDDYRYHEEKRYKEDKYGHQTHPHQQHRKKKSFLSDFFDFD